MKDALITIFSIFSITLIELLHKLPGAVTLIIQWTIGILTIIYLLKQIKAHGRNKKTT